MKKAKGFIAEVKKFISRGSVIDLAVGVIIGSAPLRQSLLPLSTILSCQPSAVFLAVLTLPA